MRACAILVESMVLSLWMSSGRTMPATISSRISKLTRISCLPSTTRLPFCSTWVTTAAMLVVRLSWRWIEPLPSNCDVPFAVNRLPGRNFCACGLSAFETRKSLMVGPCGAGLVALRLVGEIGLVVDGDGHGEEFAELVGALVLEEGARAVPPQ